MWKIVNVTSPRPVSATVIFAPTLESKNAHRNGTAPRSGFVSAGPLGWRTVVEDIAREGSRVWERLLRYSSAAFQTGDIGAEECRTMNAEENTIKTEESSIQTRSSVL